VGRETREERRETDLLEAEVGTLLGRGEAAGEGVSPSCEFFSLLGVIRVPHQMH
jgi:hypothetical protein